MPMPGVLSGLNHSLEIQAWGRTRSPLCASSSCRVSRQSSSQVPSTVSLKSLSRTSSSSSSGSEAQGNFAGDFAEYLAARGIGLKTWHKLLYRSSHERGFTTTKNRSRPSEPNLRLLRHRAGVAEDEQPPLVVVHEDIAPGVDGKFFAPVDRRGVRPRLFLETRPLRRHEVADLLRQARIADVEDPKPGVEPGDVDQLAGLLDRRIVDFLAGVVRTEAAAFVAKVLVGRARRRHRRREDR